MSIEVKQLPSGRFVLLRQGDGPLNYPSLSEAELGELHEATRPYWKERGQKVEKGGTGK